MKKNEIEPKRFLSKKRLKQALMLAGILLITLALSGCEKLVETDVSAETKSTIQTVIETTSSENITEIKTIEPPEDGWTHEQLSEVMYLCGESFSLPCKQEDISDKFECGELKIVDDGYITVNGEKTSYYEMSLMYNDEFVGMACCYDDGNDKIVFSVQIRSMVVNERLLVLNGIYQETDFKLTTEALGVKIFSKEDAFKYSYKISNPKYPEEKIILTSTDEKIILFFTYSLFDFSVL